MKRFTQKPVLLSLATLCILFSGCNQDEINSLTTERDALQTQVTSLNSELSKVKSDLVALQGVSSADKTKITTLESEKSDLEKKLNAAQVALDKANTDSDELKKQLTDLQSQVEKLQDEVQALKIANYSFKDNAQVVLDAGADNLPDELQDKGDAERGFSFNSTHVYVADKGANKIWYWSLDGSSKGALKDSEGIIGGGTFKLSDVVATENGIVASNLSIRSKFKVYRWENNDSEPELIIDYEDKQARYGDTFTFEGEANGDGKLYAGNRNSPRNNVLIWNFKSGKVVNKDNPDEIILEGLKLGNYPHVEHIHGDIEYLLVNNTAITPTLYSHDGTQQLASISSEVVISRAVSGKIFDFNTKTYLAIATAGSEGGTTRNAAILVYDVSGDDLVEAFKSIDSDKLVYEKSFGQNVNGNQAGDVDVYVDPNGEFVHLLGGAANNGFVVVKVTK